MIQVSDLHKSFGAPDRALVVLKGTSLEVERGEFVALLGRSGSGKSTLLNVIAGLEMPDRGRVRIEGIELTAIDDRARTIFRRDRIGIVFQFFNLLPVLSVLDNVCLPARLGGRPRREVERRACDLLGRVGLEDRFDAFPDELSGGEQQRVATARALINAPAVVLADEPTGNLDSENAQRTLELLADLTRHDGQTVLMVTHDAAAAAAAQRTLTLADGRVVETGRAPDWDTPELTGPRSSAEER